MGEKICIGDAGYYSIIIETVATLSLALAKGFAGLSELGRKLWVIGGALHSGEVSRIFERVLPSPRLAVDANGFGIQWLGIICPLRS